jgi:plastocyanin
MKRSAKWVSMACTATFLAVMATASPSGAVGFERFVQARDDCDPATFNAALGAGACVGNGHTTFSRFLQEVQLVGRAPAWLFVPRQVNVRAGEPFRVDNLGGEFHTFTEVEEFGGGVVPLLNQLSGAGPTRPECQAEASDDNIALPAGARSHKTEDDKGSFRYQCCIHPWMHAILKVG